MTHTPTPPSETEAPIKPDHQHGAWTNCECADCRERRLADDRHALYTPHDMCDAWKQGYLAALEQRINTTGCVDDRRVP